MTRLRAKGGLGRGLFEVLSKNQVESMALSVAMTDTITNASIGRFAIKSFMSLALVIGRGSWGSTPR